MRRQRYTDEQVAAMLTSGQWLHYAEAIRTAAKERGLPVTSVTPLADVAVLLRKMVVRS